MGVGSSMFDGLGTVLAIGGGSIVAAGVAAGYCVGNSARPITSGLPKGGSAGGSILLPIVIGGTGFIFGRLSADYGPLKRAK
jgi:hypothetical protein